MDFLNLFGFIVNLISLVTIIVSVYIFFTDIFRRWLFFGYKPTAVVIVMDYITKDVLIIKRGSVHSMKSDVPWHFPQGGIYSSDLNGAVNNILDREFKLSPHEYDFEKTVILGKKKINERKIYGKYNFGSFSLYSSLKGKAYVACIVYTNLKIVKKKLVFGFELEDVKILNLNKALKMIDPQKAKMIQKVSKEILDRQN